MNLLINKEQKTLLLTALAVLETEYQTIIDAPVSEVLKAQFRNDAEKIFRLKQEIVSLQETLVLDELNNQIRKLMAAGNKIPAIKFLREQRPMGLKEAKEYVESVGEREYRSFRALQGYGE